ncbi:hypothetical protein PINS_up004473 [Pythium insidiosum]|nr:hypothetical protein PINS_up004473 [Pythium insidiosum]
MASTTASTITTTTTSNTNSETDADEEPLVFPDPPAVPWPRELLCRYPNKPCPHRRVPKRDGELHSYCAYHRHKAQQYQRKLDQKKKLRRRRSDDQDTETKLSDEHAVMRFCDPRGGGLGQPLSHVNLPILSASTPAPHLGAVALEPFDRPVSLQDDDIHLLQALLLEEAPKHGGAHPYASRHQRPVIVACVCRRPRGLFVYLPAPRGRNARSPAVPSLLVPPVPMMTADRGNERTRAMRGHSRP